MDMLDSLNSTYDLRYYSVDNKGNKEVVNSKQIVLDAENPTSVTLDPPSGNFSIAKEIKFTCIDALSHCKYIRYSTVAGQAADQYSSLDYPNPDPGNVGATITINATTTIYYYGEDEAGNTSYSNSPKQASYTFSNSMDNVTGENATIGDKQVTLSWVNPSGANSSGFKGVKIFRAENGYPTDPTATPLFDSASTKATSYQDTNVLNGITYYYRLFAYGDASPTNYASGVDLLAVPVDSTPPGNVTGFSATSGEPTVVLSWINPTDPDFAGVVIRKSSTAIPDSITVGILVYQGSEATYTDSNVQNNSKYYYRIFAYDAVNNFTTSVVSAVANTKDTIAPASVSNFKALGRDGSVQLSWVNPTAADFAKVIIRRDLTNYPVSTVAGTGVYEGTSTSVEDTNVINNTNYYYSVFALDVTGNVSPVANGSAHPNAEYLSKTTPLDGATEVSVVVPSISAEFTQAIADTSISANSITLKSANNIDVTGTVGLANGTTNTLGFMPTEKLALKTPYTATLSSTLTDTSSAPLLASNYSWTFTTEDGVWSTTSMDLAPFDLLQLSDGYYLEPTAIAADNAGMAIAVWQQRTMGTDGLYADRILVNRFSVQQGWDPLQTKILSDLSSDLYNENPKIAVDSAGNAVVVWEMGSGFDATIFGAGYNVATNTWTQPTRIQDDQLISGSEPRVSMNDTGTVAVAWLQTSQVVSSSEDVFANVFAFNNGDWSSAPPDTKIEWLDNSNRASTRINIHVASNGDVLAAWKQYNPSNIDTVEYNIYRQSSGSWYQPDSATPAQHPNPSLVVDASRDADILSLLSDDNDNILVVYKLINSLWSVPFSIANATTAEAQLISVENPGSQIYGVPGMAMNGSGTAYISWGQTIVSGGGAFVLVNKYDMKTNKWQGFTPLSTLTSTIYFGSEVVTVDPAGNALVFYDKTYSVFAHRITVDSNWSNLTAVPPTIIEPEIAGGYHAYNISAVVDKEGHAAAIWQKEHPLTPTHDAIIVKGSRFTIQSPNPDLQVLVSNAVSNGTNLNFDYTITNTGTVDATAFIVDFWQNPVTVPTASNTGEIIVEFAGGLAAGQSTSGSRSIQLSSVVDTGVMLAYVDLPNSVVEVNEFNNYSDLKWNTVLAPQPTLFGFENGLIPAQITLSGDAIWTVDTTTGAGGSSTSLKSGVVGTNQGSCLSMQLTDAAQVSLDYRVSSEQDHDILNISSGFYRDS